MLLPFLLEALKIYQAREELEKSFNSTSPIMGKIYTLQKGFGLKTQLTKPKLPQHQELALTMPENHGSVYPGGLLPIFNFYQ